MSDAMTEGFRKSFAAEAKKGTLAELRYIPRQTEEHSSVYRNIRTEYCNGECISRQGKGHMRTGAGRRERFSTERL